MATALLSTIHRSPGPARAARAIGKAIVTLLLWRAERRMRLHRPDFSARMLRDIGIAEIDV
jgi:uncharacterized protein YjiS (DUF1127 family)